MKRISSFRDLEAWRLSMDLVQACFELSGSFPKSEIFGLTAQFRRAALSIPSNLAEGHRRPRPAYLNHVSIALGSHAELETCLEVASEAAPQTAEACGSGSASLDHSVSLPRVPRGVDVLKARAKLDSSATDLGLQDV
ncbi:MAG: four helix bundle protein [Acidobacteriota bacterium]